LKQVVVVEYFYLVLFVAMVNKKSNKRKGDILEYLVAILEKSIADNPTTKIFTKHIIKDRDGVSRELDVYVEAVVNRKVMKYAFECKNYKKGIALIHITDFYSKLEGLGIQGFFVTTSNYQSGAISKAKALNIELFTLKKKEIGGDDLKGLLLVRKQYAIVGVSVFGEKERSELSVEDVFSTCENCKASLRNLVDKHAIPTLLSNLNEGIEMVGSNSDDLMKFKFSFGKNNAREFGFIVFFDGTTITHKGIIIPIDMIIIEMKEWNEIYKDIPLSPQSFSYCSNNERTSSIQFSHANFAFEDQNLLVTLIRHPDGKTYGSVGRLEDMKNTDVHSLFPLGTIDELNLASNSAEDNHEDAC
jgi:hypothetical protein